MRLKLILLAFLCTVPAFSQTPTLMPVYSTATADWQIKPVAVPTFAIAAPMAPTSHAPTSGGSCDAGTHLWAVTFINAAGETTIGDAATVQTCGANATEGLTAIPIGPTATTGRNVYRTKEGTSTPFYLDCASAPCIANNTATTFSDTLADSALGAAPPSSNTTGPVTVVAVDAYLKTITVTNPTGSAQTFTVADLQGSPISVLGAVSVAANTTYVIAWPAYYWCPNGFTIIAGGSGLTVYAAWRQK